MFLKFKAYVIHIISLISCILFFPSNDAYVIVAVFLSTSIIVKIFHDISVLVLVLISIVINIIFPLFVLFRIGETSSISPFQIKYWGLQNILLLIAPTLSITLAYYLIKWLNIKQ
jgi:hypothetical protein